MKNSTLPKNSLFLFPLYLLFSVIGLFAFCKETEKNKKANTSTSAQTNTLVEASTNQITTSQDKTYGATVRIKADVTGNARALPIYGFNGNNLSVPWTIKKFRDTAASLHFKMIRYPGGSIANKWDWQNGWYTDQNFANRNVPNKVLGEKSPYTLKELKLIVDQTKCEVVYVLNMITRDVNDQLEMLKAARDLGLPVKYVEFGNEFNAPQNKSWDIFKTANGYGEQCNAWIQKIKTVFPNAKFGVVGGNVANVLTSNWNKKTIEKSTQTNGITAHIYVNYKTVTDNTGINFKKLFTELNRVYDLRGFNDTQLPDIWVTEYNIQWAAKDNDIFDANLSQSKSKLISYSSTWSQSLASIFMTSYMTGISDRTTIILNHNITNSPVFAAIDPKNDSYRKLPNGVGMEIWLKACENMTTAQKLSFSSVSSADQLPDYNVCGWKFANNGKYSILIENLTENSLKIDLSKLTSDVNPKVSIHYGEKNGGLETLNNISGTINNRSIDIPAYSVVTIAN